jgi:hypothetical protein
MQVNIAVDLNHPVNEVAGVKQDVSPDEPQVCFPADWEAWKDSLDESVRMNSLIQIKFSLTANSQTVAIAICEDGTEDDAFDLLMEGRRAFGFIVNVSTLRQLRGAIDAAIASME